MIPKTTTQMTTTRTTTKATTPFQTYPVVAGLRALIRSSVALDINQANSILQQYLSYLQSYYNVTGRVTSIKKV
ncbi:hypothetical protein PGIGA_G00208640 [Pangasianodon gigas]|uniref:Uncharacterized protein n=1 Tax=Pangasianodon gigas TaxID=30993 RepID=A0ACC5WFR4_PANGG|nr:hypothetical protein [Pangasianodon gigas]